MNYVTAYYLNICLAKYVSEVTLIRKTYIDCYTILDGSDCFLTSELEEFIITCPFLGHKLKKFLLCFDNTTYVPTTKNWLEKFTEVGITWAYSKEWLMEHTIYIFHQTVRLSRFDVSIELTSLQEVVCGKKFIYR